MEAEKIIDDLCLIDNVVVNYSQGRRRGLTDEETEDRALKAVSLAMEILEKEVPKKPTILERCPNDQDGFKITIPGRPVPKGRPRLGVHGRKAYVYTPPKTKEYEKLVGWVARCAGCKPLNGPLAVKLHLFIRGRSGDVDNYCKSILDGLNGVAYEDDRQVQHLEVDIYRETPERAEVEIMPLEMVREGAAL